MILFIGILLSSLLEMIGIGSIPIFISFLIEPNKLLAYLPQNNLVNFISNQNYTYQVTFFGAILLGIFIFKNLFLFVINYFQAVFFREIKIKNSERLFTNYLYSPYSFHLDRNPATVVRDIFGEVQNSVIKEQRKQRSRTKFDEEQHYTTPDPAADFFCKTTKINMFLEMSE